MRSQYVAAALILCAVSGAHAANSFLGFIATEGSFQLDQSKVWGTATLFEGSVVETRVSPCKVRLQDGSEIRLDAGSRARFFAGRAVIEKGALEFHATAAYKVEALSFRISANPPHTVGVVRFAGPAGVTASTLKGGLLVATAEGAPVADVPPGKNVTVTPDDAATASVTKVTGCIQSASKAIVLVDEASNLTFVLQGQGVAAEVGNRVELTGAARPQAAKGARQILDVSNIHVVGVCVAAKSSRRPMLTRTAAVIGGVAVAGSVGAVELSRALTTSDQPDSVSRQ